MTQISDSYARYGLISRILHWGMAILFLAQFLSAAARWALPQQNALREALWSYHAQLGATLFFLVLLRGAWGLSNLSRRPRPHAGLMGQLALTGHIAIYALMVVVPTVRLLAAAGSDRGFSYLGIPIFTARETEVAWMQAPSEWHGEMGWILGLLILGHIAMAMIWHHKIKRDDTLRRMAG